jgi:hypothetical protein
MDETGNGIRREKARDELVVCSNRTSGPGQYRDASDITHVSLVAPLSLSGASLKHMFLPISEAYYNDYYICVQKDLLVTCKNPKRSITSERATRHLSQIVKPYCERLGREHNDDRLPVYLVIDNCATHNRPMKIFTMLGRR